MVKTAITTNISQAVSKVHNDVLESQEVRTVEITVFTNRYNKLVVQQATLSKNNTENNNENLNRILTLARFTRYQTFTQTTF